MRRLQKSAWNILFAKSPQIIASGHPAMDGTSGNKNDRFFITPKINRLTVSLWFEDCCDSKQIWLSCTAIHQFGSFSTFCRLTRSKVSHHGKYCFWHTFSRTSDHYQLNADDSFQVLHYHWFAAECKSCFTLFGLDMRWLFPLVGHD